MKKQTVVITILIILMVLLACGLGFNFQESVPAGGKTEFQIAITDQPLTYHFNVDDEYGNVMSIKDSRDGPFFIFDLEDSETEQVSIAKWYFLKSVRFIHLHKSRLE